MPNETHALLGMKLKFRSCNELPESRLVDMQSPATHLQAVAVQLYGVVALLAHKQPA